MTESLVQSQRANVAVITQNSPAEVLPSPLPCHVCSVSASGSRVLYYNPSFRLTDWIFPTSAQTISTPAEPALVLCYFQSFVLTLFPYLREDSTHLFMYFHHTLLNWMSAYSLVLSNSYNNNNIDNENNKPHLLSTTCFYILHKF
jgi:hypothetical protein